MSCLFATSALACAAPQDPRSIAAHWANHYAALYQVDPDLVHSIIEVESAWRPTAVSNKGAVGLMQLMPATAVTFGVANRFEVEQNIRGGVAYLARLQDVFQGDLRLVAAAYVAGERRILPARLGYSNAEVFHYVIKIGRLYRERRRWRRDAERIAGSKTTGGKDP